jgi:hypothetical protein
MLYHIVSLADIQESGAKMDHWMKKQRTISAKGSNKRKSNARGTSSAESH